MNRKATAVVAVYLFSTLADMGITLYATPDLSLEGNPLVAVFGLGWGALLLANGLCTLAVVLLARYAHAVYRSPALPAAGFRQFVSLLFFNRPDRFRWCFYHPCCNTGPALAMFGYALCYAVTAAHLFAALEWALYLSPLPAASYLRLRDSLPLGSLPFWLVVAYAQALLLYWLLREYRNNLRALAKKSPLLAREATP